MAHLHTVSKSSKCLKVSDAGKLLITKVETLSISDHLLRKLKRKCWTKGKNPQGFLLNIEMLELKRKLFNFKKLEKIVGTETKNNIFTSL